MVHHGVTGLQNLIRNHPLGIYFVQFGLILDILYLGCIHESSVTFTHADGAALPVLPIAIAAVLVTGEGRTLDTAAHLTAMLVPPAGQQTIHPMNHTQIQHNCMKGTSGSKQCHSCPAQTRNLQDEEQCMEQHGAVIE